MAYKISGIIASNLKALRIILELLGIKIKMKCWAVVMLMNNNTIHPQMIKWYTCRVSVMSVIR